MAVYLAPIGNGQQFFDNSGNPLNAGNLYTYDAGTTTLESTYTTSAGSVANANPIVLSADGRPATEIWLASGLAYKFVLEDSSGNTLGTWDNLTGINDIAANTFSEWVTFSGSPTYVSTTSFTLSGNQTLNFSVNTRVKTTNTGGTIYGTITASSYNAGTGITTITITPDSGTLDSGISAVAYGFANATNPSVGVAESALIATTQSAGDNSTKIATTAYVQTEGDVRYIRSGADGSAPSPAIAAGGTININQIGQTLSLLGNATLPTPVGNAGARITLRNNNVASVITTPSGSIYGPDGTNYGTTWTMDASYFAWATFISDGANWIIAFKSGRTIVSNAVNSNEAVALGQVIGLGQTWQEVSNIPGARVTGTIYQNTTGKPIVAAVYASSSSTQHFYVGSVSPPTVITILIAGDSYIHGASVIIPDQWYYELDGGSIAAWAELK